MPFGPTATEGERPAQDAAVRRERRRTWLAQVDTALAEASAMLDAIAADDAGSAEVRARVAAAREAVGELGARLGGGG